ncbi:MAG: calcium-binding protein [Actinomycetota bacterium]
MTLGSLDRRSGVAFLVAAALILWLAPLAGTASANHSTRTLDVEPESTPVPLNASHSMTATLSEAADLDSGTINIDFENEEGVNDPDGDTPESPDLTCAITSGQESCTVSYVGTVTGEDEWRAWIDHDGSNGSVEADPLEGRSEVTRPGTPNPLSCLGATPPSGEPDCTDVVEVLWGGNALDCDDESDGDTERETNPSGGGSASNEDYLCSVINPEGDPVEDVVVSAENEGGPNDPDDSASYDTPDRECTTSDLPPDLGGGTCEITITQAENQPGTAAICFWIDGVGPAECPTEDVGEGQAADGSDEPTDAADKTEKTWEDRRASGIDAEPENAANEFETEHEITVTVFDQFSETFPGNTTVNFEFFQGAPTDTDGNSPESPDATCQTSGSSCSFTYTQTATPGTDLLCVWANDQPVMEGTHNNGECNGESLADENDAEDETDEPEPADDDVDVVQKIWQNPTEATRLECEPETGSNRRGSSHTVTCTTSDDGDAPVAGAEIDVEAAGANDPDDDDSPGTPDFGCVSGENGKCSFTHGPDGLGPSSETGTTLYTAWIDEDNDNSTDELDPAEGRNEEENAGEEEPDNTDVVEKRWTKGGCTVSGTSRGERLRGTSGRDVICGGGGNDTLIGRGGNDKLRGGRGNDDIFGNSGRDRLFGNAGRDLLNGGRGDDRCKGGPGRDRQRSC